MTYHNENQNRITDVNSATGTAYPFRVPNLIATFRVAQYLVFV
jgi:hypothetical protein